MENNIMNDNIIVDSISAGRISYLPIDKEVDSSNKLWIKDTLVVMEKTNTFATCKFVRVVKFEPSALFELSVEYLFNVKNNDETVPLGSLSDENILTCVKQNSDFAFSKISLLISMITSQVLNNPLITVPHFIEN